jgi:hypothetical protein
VLDEVMTQPAEPALHQRSWIFVPKLTKAQKLRQYASIIGCVVAALMLKRSGLLSDGGTALALIGVLAVGAAVDAVVRRTRIRLVETALEVRLKWSLGPLTTIPYGEIEHLEMFRDRTDGSPGLRLTTRTRGALEFGPWDSSWAGVERLYAKVEHARAAIADAVKGAKDRGDGVMPV